MCLLIQIQKSVDTKDRFLFDKYVDTNGIITEIVEDLSDKIKKGFTLSCKYEFDLGFVRTMIIK